MDGDLQERVSESLVLYLPVALHHKVVSMEYDVGVVYEAYFRVELRVEIRNEGVPLCIHRMETEGSNKNLLQRDVSWVEVGNVDAHYYKATNANTR